MFDKEFVLKTAADLLAIDSPSGYTFKATEYIAKIMADLGLKYEYTAKGNLMVYVPGEQKGVLGLSAHVDTLGLMVRSIKDNGHLAITKVGGPLMPSLDGEYCRIITRDQKVYTGTILSISPSAHVYKDADTVKREEDKMEIRIDELVKNKEDVMALGIMNGDYVVIEPKVAITASGFIKSRFLDDKISAAALIGVLAAITKEKIIPKRNLCIIFSTYEEVGHGGAFIPADIEELLAVDMGCIGEDLMASEEDVSICAKDSGGPYDYGMVSRLLDLAKQNGLQYAVDIYPMYGSDVSSALRAGNNIKGALIGPGVHASHGMERTHYHALENTMKLIMAYIRAY